MCTYTVVRPVSCRRSSTVRYPYKVTLYLSFGESALFEINQEFSPPPVEHGYFFG